MYTGENYEEVKREDDSSDISTYQHDDNTGTSMFYLSIDAALSVFTYVPTVQQCLSSVSAQNLKELLICCN